MNPVPHSIVTTMYIENPASTKAVYMVELDTNHTLCKFRQQPVLDSYFCCMS